MINRIEITNFLSHKITKLDLSPGVNVIVGPTDSGKSAIIRALRWVTTNRPLGDSFRSSWGGATAVSLHFNGQVVTRLKSDNRNSYLINTDNRFDAVKSDVPEEVSQILDLNELNLQTQFESHFLLSKSPGEVALHFNQVAHLDKIDFSLGNIQRWLRETERGLEVNQSQLENYNQQLLQYKNVDEIEEKLFKLESIERELKQITSDQNALDELIDTLSKVEEKIQASSFLFELDEALEKVIKVIDNCKAIKKQISELSEFLEDYNRVAKQENSQLDIIAELEEEFHKQLKGVCSLCGQIIK